MNPGTNNVKCIQEKSQVSKKKINIETISCIVWGEGTIH